MTLAPNATAVQEFLKEYSSYYEMVNIRNTRQPSLILKKIEF